MRWRSSSTASVAVSPIASSAAVAFRQISASTGTCSVKLCVVIRASRTSYVVCSVSFRFVVMRPRQPDATKSPSHHLPSSRMARIPSPAARVVPEAQADVDEPEHVVVSGVGSTETFGQSASGAEDWRSSRGSAPRAPTEYVPGASLAERSPEGRSWAYRRPAADHRQRRSGDPQVRCRSGGRTSRPTSRQGLRRASIASEHGESIGQARRIGDAPLWRPANLGPTAGP